MHLTKTYIKSFHQENRKESLKDILLVNSWKTRWQHWQSTTTGVDIAVESQFTVGRQAIKTTSPALLLQPRNQNATCLKPR